MQTRRYSAERSPLLQLFFSALDGMRGLAILLVVSWHYCTLVFSSPALLWGWSGVSIFFVLSGFLITGILVDTLHRSDYFRNFYIRRTLRIFPLYFAIWAFLLLATPVLHPAWNRYVVATVFYIGNWFKAGAGVTHPDPAFLFLRLRHNPRTLLIDHFWSLGVEEQFYLVWPFVVWYVRSTRKLLVLCLVLVCASPVLRWAYMYAHADASGARVLYYNTLARTDSLLLGAAMALWLRNSPPRLSTLRRFGVLLLVTGTGAIFLLRLSEPKPRVLSLTDFRVLTFGFTFINVAAAGLLLLLLEQRSLLSRIFEVRPLVWFGRISYGVYVFNELILTEGYRQFKYAHTQSMRYVFCAGLFLINIALAELSFRFLESPFLRLKTRFAPRAGAINDPPPAGEEICELSQGTTQA